MGKAISYCFKCSVRLRDDDFERGKAARIGDHVACAACAAEAGLKVPTAPTSVPRSPRPSLVNTAPMRITSATPAWHPPEPLPRQRRAWVIGGIVAALGVILSIVALSRNDRPAPKEDSAPRTLSDGTGRPEPPPSPVDPQIAAGQRAFEAARRWAQAHPADLSGQLREYTSVALQFDRTPGGKEAMGEIVRLKAESTSRVTSALSDLERETRPFVDRGNFAGAFARLEAAEKKLPLSEWAIAVRNRKSSLREESLRAKLEVPDLVAHWALNEGKGVIARDSSGHGHEGQLRGNAAWAEGSFGGVRFDGENSWIDIKRDPVMDSLQTGNYSLMLWFMPEGCPQGSGDQNTAVYGLLMKPGYHLGLAYDNEMRFRFHHWLSSHTDVARAAEHPSTPGRFYHVACTIDRSGGSVHLYVDGVPEGSNSFQANAPTYDYEGNLWRMGFAAPGTQVYAWPARGVIQEPRMYARALSSTEIRRIYELRR